MYENYDDIYQITNEDFNDVRINNQLQVQYQILYESFISIKDFYDDELQDTLILSKPRELKMFFRSINDRLKSLYKDFVQMKFNLPLRETILIQIRDFINKNLSLAKQHIKKEKLYNFSNEGVLKHDEIY